jgi:uncharacterized MAPEG superfamily protein
MSNESSGENRIRQQAIQEATLIARAVQLDEAERRFRELEERVITRHTQTMTWILTAVSSVMAVVAIIVAILGYLSKSDTAQEVRDARQQFNRETDRMEKRFDQMKNDFQQQFNAFAGDALKKPAIEIKVQTNFLSNATLHWTLNRPLLLPLFIKNVGQKRTDPPTLYLYCSMPINAFPGDIGDWFYENSNDSEFAFKYRLGRPGAFGMLGIAPGETWAVNDSPFDSPGFRWNFPTNSISAKLVVFYGSESPAEAHFHVTNGP